MRNCTFLKKAEPVLEGKNVVFQGKRHIKGCKNNQNLMFECRIKSLEGKNVVFQGKRHIKGVKNRRFGRVENVDF